MVNGPQNHFRSAYAGAIDRAEVDAGLRAYMLRVYNYMATGLAISGLIAWVIANVPAVTQVFYTPIGYTMSGNVAYSPTALGMIGMFAPLGVLLIASFAGRNWSAGTTQAMYWLFVALQGVSLSILLFAYTGESVVRVFFITAAAFGGLSLYGYTTKRNLSAMGSFLIMGLIGLLVAAVVNMFLASSMLSFVISAAGVLIFSGLIAYDTQRIKDAYVAGFGSREMETKAAVWSALALYINFINLLQFLLMILGNRQ
ncbi:MAG: Bax inhibitor-1/YccA family protein [Rhodospirillaceae bacterium]|nr:Bax inhibitor-1/YccA family protein [Rhodospirillaceae bacterium]